MPTIQETFEYLSTWCQSDGDVPIHTLTDGVFCNTSLSVYSWFSSFISNVAVCWTYPCVSFSVRIMRCFEDWNYNYLQGWLGGKDACLNLPRRFEYIIEFIIARWAPRAVFTPHSCRPSSTPSLSPEMFFTLIFPSQVAVFLVSLAPWDWNLGLHHSPLPASTDLRRGGEKTENSSPDVSG